MESDVLDVAMHYTCLESTIAWAELHRSVVDWLVSFGNVPSFAPEVAAPINVPSFAPGVAAPINDGTNLELVILTHVHCIVLA